MFDFDGDDYDDNCDDYDDDYDNVDESMCLIMTLIIMVKSIIAPS